MSISFNGKNFKDLLFNGHTAKQIFYGAQLVWQKAVKELIFGDEFVCIAYKPTSTETISNTSIFLDSDMGSNVYFGIMHESGLLLALSQSGGSVSETKYGLEGYKTTATSFNLTLKKDETYYFCYKKYQHSTSSSGEQEKPNFAYFKNSNNKGKYKIKYLDGNLSVCQSDISSLTYKGKIYPATGVVDSALYDIILKLPVNSLFIAEGNNITGHSTTAYKRNSDYPYVIPGETSQVAAYRGKVQCINSELDFPTIYNLMFQMNQNDIIYNENPGNLGYRCYFYKKTDNTLDNSKYKGAVSAISSSLGAKDNFFYWNTSTQMGVLNTKALYKLNMNMSDFYTTITNEDMADYGDAKRLAYAFMTVGTTSGRVILWAANSITNTDLTNGALTQGYFRKSVNVQNNHITSLTPLSEEPTGQHQDYDLYYKAANTNWSTGSGTESNFNSLECIAIWHSGCWHVAKETNRCFEIYDLNGGNTGTQATWNNFAEKINTTIYTEVSRSDSSITNCWSSVGTFDNNFVNATEYTDKKYYLEINGTEAPDFNFGE